MTCGVGSWEGAVGFHFWGVYVEKLVCAEVFIWSALGGRKRRRENCFLIGAEAAYHIVCAGTWAFVGREVNVWFAYLAFIVTAGKKNPKETISTQ